MVFSSLEFLFVFLPVFLLVYYLTPYRQKNLILLLGSLIFYYYGAREQPLYLLLIVASIFVNYMIGNLIEISRGSSRQKIWLATGLIYNFGWLFLFKYLDFVSENLNHILGIFNCTGRIPKYNLVLPVGISFYTFQIVSYLLDVYWNRVSAEKKVISLGTYLCMFPQLIAGPIVTYPKLGKQIAKRKHSFAEIEKGLRVFTIGLGFKVLLANRIGSLWSEIGAIGYESISTPLAWLGSVGYSLQLYFDFYGYSLMAIGLGRMLGFRLPENFKHPYMSLTMTEFWRRWHITLGAWFRDYIYIPLGGSRCSRRKMVRNIIFVWLLTGIWHGASWNFVLWGMVICMLILLEKAGMGKVLNRYPLLGHIYMCLAIPLTWMIFAITDLSQLGTYFSRLFPVFGKTGTTVFMGDFFKYGRWYGVLILVGLLFCTKYPAKIYLKLKNNLLSSILLLIVFWASVYCMYKGMDDPFLYFRF